jgi:hypothetical protein
MKNVLRLFCFTAILVAVSVPLAERKFYAATQQPRVHGPQVVADSLPVPWGKKPGGNVAVAPVQTADSLPVPWCKAGPPHCADVTPPQAIADSLPVPWGKKPGGAKFEAAPIVADSLPVPWGKKPVGTRS